MSAENAATLDPLVWQNYGASEVYHRDGCPHRKGGVWWRRSFAAADAEHGLGLRPCKRCHPEVDDAV